MKILKKDENFEKNENVEKMKILKKNEKDQRFIWQKIRHKSSGLKVSFWPMRFFPPENCKKQPLVIFIANDSLRVKHFINNLYGFETSFILFAANNLHEKIMYF